jgi:hypothetical protein
MEMLLLGSNPVFKHSGKMNIGTLKSGEYSHSLKVFNCRITKSQKRGPSGETPNDPAAGARIKGVCRRQAGDLAV